ncbi:MAG: hypothetical protein JO235_05610 [Chroococcidiopsidaceae cyanobacterium CP_BM_RX_35]|nr:hypothetical protein [Chroococcidiopsidaceae cyanobacterium CP_BM_RX_35]
MSKQPPVSPWTYKPWWCQPWSIILTGIALIGGSWVWGKLLWLTVLVSVPVLTWMGFFLLVWPWMIRHSGMVDSNDAE